MWKRMRGSGGKRKAIPKSEKGFKNVSDGMLSEQVIWQNDHFRKPKVRQGTIVEN